MTVFYKTTGAFSHHIVLNLENIEVAVVQNNTTKMEHLFSLTLLKWTRLLNINRGLSFGIFNVFFGDEVYKKKFHSEP